MSPGSSNPCTNERNSHPNAADASIMVKKRRAAAPGHRQVCDKVCVPVLPEFSAQTARPGSHRFGLTDTSATINANSAIEVFQN
jgi:hypothetical protein